MSAGLRRGIARWQTWWMRAFVVLVLVLSFGPEVGGFSWPWPGWLNLVFFAVPVVLAFVRPPRVEADPVPVAAPVRGRWAALNSPGTAVPSHGIRAYGQRYAIDILHPLPPGTEVAIGWGLPRRAEEYPTFGDTVHAVADGVVVAVADRTRDHRGRDTWPWLMYMMVIEGFLRDLRGVAGVIGNRVVIEHDDGVFSLYAHLRRGSARVRPGDRVSSGAVIGEVGNTGNSSEPHLHVQLMDRALPTAAAGLPFRWHDITIEPGDTDPSRSTKPVATDVVEGLPANGQVFTAPAAQPR